MEEQPVLGTTGRSNLEANGPENIVESEEDEGVSQPVIQSETVQDEGTYNDRQSVLHNNLQNCV